MIKGTKISFNNKEKILMDMEDILDSGMVSNGKYCRLCEEEWKKSYGGECFVCGSGTEAIELALKALNIKEGSTVIIPSLAPPMIRWAVRKANCSTWTKDINRDMFMLDSDFNLCSAIIVVHIGGWINPKIKEIAKFCKENDIFLIEDCSHAHGCTLNCRLAGTFGDCAVWSFYATKTLNCGEGGMIMLNRPFNLDLRAYINQGRDEKGNYKSESYNYRMSEMQAVLMYNTILNSRMIYNNKRLIAHEYDRLLEARDLKDIIFRFQGQGSTYYKYILKIKDENADSFFRNNDIILPSKVYPKRELIGIDLNNFPNTKYATENHICLPIHQGLTLKDIHKIIEMVDKYAKRVQQREDIVSS